MTIRLRGGRGARGLAHRAAVVLVVLVTGACSVSTDEDPQAAGDLFAQLVETSTTTTSTTAPENVTKPATVYFLNTTDGTTELVPVERDVAVAAGMQEILSNLFTVPPGPKRPRTEWGLSSAIPDSATLLSATVTPGTSRLVVDVNGLFGGIQGTQLRNALAQIVWTATESPEVSEVSFRSNGSAVAATVGSGELVDGPVERNDYTTLS
jgi:spore germination protein GerM